MKQIAPPTLLGKLLTVVAAIAVLAVALMFSVIFFAIALTVGLILGTRIWWRTRTLRKQGGFRPPAGGRVIEGEAVRESVEQVEQEKAER